MTASEKGKFFARASIAGVNECWPWQGARSGSGYGYITMRRNKRKWNLLAHRVAKGIALGRELAKEENLHHTCENILCVNPRHLEIVAREDHKALHRPESCHRGHPLSGENVYVTPKGYKVCRACRVIYQRAFRRRHGIGK